MSLFLIIDSSYTVIKTFLLHFFNLDNTLSLFYKECSKIMYSPHFWILYSCSLIFTELFV